MKTFTHLPTNFGKRAALFFAGSVFVGVGIAILVKTGLGVAPLDMVNTGLSAHTGLAVGTCLWLVSIVIVLLAWIAGRTPKPGTLIGTLLLGWVINLVLPILPTMGSLPVRIAFAAFGLGILYISIAVYVTSNLGAGPSEEFMLALSERGMKLHHARWGIEATLFVVGLALGGQFGVFTVIFVLLTGPALAWLIPRAVQLFKLPQTAVAAGPELEP